jgi:hypothetical protein
MRQLEYVVRGLKRLAVGRPRCTRLPITLSILGRLKQVWEGDPKRRDATMW